MKYKAITCITIFQTGVACSDLQETPYVKYWRKTNTRMLPHERRGHCAGTHLEQGVTASRTHGHRSGAQRCHSRSSWCGPWTRRHPEQFLLHRYEDRWTHSWMVACRCWDLSPPTYPTIPRQRFHLLVRVLHPVQVPVHWLIGVDLDELSASTHHVNKQNG